MKSWFGLFCLLCLSNVLYCQQARQTVLFNEGWKFYKGDIVNGEALEINDASWRTVDLPHDWSVEGPFSKEWASGTGFLPGGIGWYRKIFTSEGNASNKKVFIYFDGVYKNSEVWLNGKLLGERPNGFIPFQYELTPYLKKGKNLIAVRVDHSKFADSRFYTGSGIYRNVYLITKNPIHVPAWGARFTTPEISAQKAKAVVGVLVNNTLSSAANIRIKVELLYAGKLVTTSSQTTVVNGGSEKEATLTLQVSQPKLWTVEQPNLYTLSITIYQNEKKLDDCSERVGFRTIKFDANKGFFLNGKNMKLKGVCIHHDAGALGAAVPRDVWKRRLQKLKEVGCNAIRMSHYPHQDYLYDLCDEMSFLVQDEAFDEWEYGKNKWIEGWNAGTPGKDGYHEYFNEWAERDVKDMIRRNKNHPSIIMWSIGNEIDYPNDPYSAEVLNTGRNPQIYGRGYMPDHPPASRLGELSKMLVIAAKSIDTTRPITAALAGVVMSNTTIYPSNLDIVGYNYQEYRYAEDHKVYPDRIIYGSENGKGTEAWMAVDTSQNIFGQFLWTGYDFLGEAGRWPSRSSGAGLLDLAGFPKTDFYTRQALWVDKPVIYLTASRISNQQERGFRNVKPSWNWNSGDSIRVNCITNADEVELFLNGRLLGRKSKTDTGRRNFTWAVQYEQGELVAKGFSKGKEVSSFKLISAGKAATIEALPDKKQFHIGNKEVAHIEIAIKDKNGNIVLNDSTELTTKVTGPAKLIGLESGDLTSHEDYKAGKRKVYNGRLLAYIESTGEPGAVTVTISGYELQVRTVRLPISK